MENFSSGPIRKAQAVCLLSFSSMARVLVGALCVVVTLAKGRRARTGCTGSVKANRSALIPGISSLHYISTMASPGLSATQCRAGTSEHSSLVLLADQPDKL